MIRVLLDSNVPRRYRNHLPFAEVVHVSERNWQSLRNGDLLRTAEGEFDAILTVDKNMPFQSQIAGRDLTVVVLDSPTNRMRDLVSFVPFLEAHLMKLERGRFYRVSSAGELEPY